MNPEIKTILVPMDGSAPAERAFELASHIASRTGAKIVLFSAVDPDKMETPTYAVGIGDIAPDMEPAKNSARAYLAEKAAQLPQGVAHEEVVDVGRAENLIEEETKSAPIDLIVMGNSGKGSLSSFVTGSVSYYTIHHVKCPVLIVK